MADTPNPTSLNFWQSRTAVVLFLFLFFPVGLYLLWKSPNFNRPAQIAISIVVTILFLGSTVVDPPQDNNEDAEYVAPSDEETQTDEETQKYIVSPSQLDRILSGCCKGAGGTYSAYGDCIGPLEHAFGPCVERGNLYLRTDRGEIHQVDYRRHLRGGTGR